MCSSLLKRDILRPIESKGADVHENGKTFSQSLHILYQYAARHFLSFFAIFHRSGVESTIPKNYNAVNHYAEVDLCDISHERSQ